MNMKDSLHKIYLKVFSLLTLLYKGSKFSEKRIIANHSQC